MAAETSQDPHEHSDGPGHVPQHDYVTRFRPDPSAPAQSALILEGLVGDSDRPARKRLYFNRSLDYYAEFSTEDVVDSETIPAEQPPMIGLEATRLAIRRDAPVEFTRLHAARPADEFDLDVRLAAMPLTAQERALLIEGTVEGTRTAVCVASPLRTVVNMWRIPTDACGTRFPATWRCLPTETLG
jgi:hypothetical protein